MGDGFKCNTHKMKEKLRVCTITVLPLSKLLFNRERKDDVAFCLKKKKKNVIENESMPTLRCLLMLKCC